MKFKVMIIVVLQFVTMSLFAGNQVVLTVTYDQPVDNQSPHQRCPPRPIIIEQNGHHFTLGEACVGDVLELFVDNKLIYSAIVDRNGRIKIPSTISGEADLRLNKGNVIYQSRVVL